MPDPQDRRTVVVIDDEEGDLAVVEAILSDDFDVVCCRSGETAFKAIESHPRALVLCDQRMPTLTGDEVMARVRVLYPETVRILVTAYSDAAAIVRALNEGQIFGYLQKPFDPVQLRTIVERAWKYQDVQLENRRLVDELRKVSGQVDSIVKERTHRLEEENRQLKDLAVTDDLTGLFNLRFLKTRMQEEYERLQRYGQSISLIMVDIDDFKRVNDEFGHLVGDSVLRQVAATVRRTVRTVDFAARYGGEEFVVLTPNTLERGARVLAERIRAGVESIKMEPEPGKVLRVTVSLGLADCEAPGGPAIEEVLRRADEAMYRAKRLGKNRTVTWSELKKILETKPQSVFVAKSGEAPKAR